MQKTGYEKVLLVGGTGLIYQAAELVRQSGVTPAIEIYQCNSNVAQRKPEGDSIRNMGAVSKSGLTEALLKEGQEALVLSVMNPYIIPGEVVRKKNLLLLNLHHALLPLHRGRNAEAWAIFEGDGQSGITWHRINEGTDTGAIYCQKSVKLDETMTSWKLLTLLNQAALEGLGEMLARGIADIIPREQAKCREGRVHLAKDIPGGGWLDLSWDGAQISRFLRAMDYGVLYTLGRPRVRLGDGAYMFRSYRIQDAAGLDEGCGWQGENWHLVKDGKEIILNKMKKMED